jgi:predicted  nucleic acid-binding Zn-ribbon protein
LAQQRAENTKLSQQIAAIKTEKTSLQKNLLALQKRIQELELQIGGEAELK